MRSVNIHEARTHLSRLVEEAARGESFIIAKAGRPVAQVTAIAAGGSPRPRRFDSPAGRIEVPEDFNTMGRSGIERMFGGW